MSNIQSKRERERQTERGERQREREGEREIQRQRETDRGERKREREGGNKCLLSYITLPLFLTTLCGEGLYILNLVISGKGLSMFLIFLVLSSDSCGSL